MILRRLVVGAFALSASVASAQSFDPALFNELKWRMIGPYRGGRTKAAVGVPSRPGLFYICLLYTSPSPRDGLLSRMPSSA